MAFCLDAQAPQALSLNPRSTASVGSWYPARVHEVVLNGEARAFATGATVASLLDELGLNATQVAVERNQEIVPRASFAVTKLANGDIFEVVTFVGGG